MFCCIDPADRDLSATNRETDTENAYWLLDVTRLTPEASGALRPNGFGWKRPKAKGWELCGTYIAGALAFAFGGFGMYSIDSAIGFYQLSSGRAAWVIIIAAVVLAFANLLVRRPAQEASTGA